MAKDAQPAKLRKKLQNKIVGYDTVDAEQLLAHPQNFRVHPFPQQQALAGSIDDIGYIDPVIVNTVTGHVIDGHLRVQLAMRSGEAVPVVYVELSEDDEKKALLMLDPIAAMAATDREQLNDLLYEVNSDDERVQEMLAGLAEREKLDKMNDVPEPEEQKEPTLAAEHLIQIYCSSDDLAAFQPTLDEWSKRRGVTIDVS